MDDQAPAQCSAATKQGARCRRPAIRASRGTAVPLCNVHAGMLRAGAGDARRCTATTASGKPCPRWGVRGSEPARCSAHGGQFAPAAEEARRCTATTASGRRCRQWAERASLARFGRALCPTHVRAAAGRPHWRAPGPEDSRRCTAITYAGSRCPRWAQPGSEPPLCRAHRYPDAQGQIRHGLFRRELPLSQVEREALAIVQETGEPADVGVLLARLLVARLLAYRQQSPRPPEKDLNGMRLLMARLDQVRKFVALRRELAPPEPWVVPPEIVAQLKEEGLLEEAPATQPAPEVSALLEEMLEDSLEVEIWVARLTLAEIFGLVTSDLPVDKLVPRARMVLRGTSLVRKLLMEEFVKQPERKRRAAAGAHPRRGRGRRGAYKGPQGGRRR